MVDAMGGKCCICGYDRCHAAMDFHHIDPTKKSFGISDKGIANPIAWSKIVEELRKCVLLCKRCHVEVHAGIVSIHDDVTMFDESFVIYNDRPTVPCPICGNDMPIGNITCSRACAATRRLKVDWDSIDIIELSKTMSNVKIGQMLGVSDVAVKKRIKKLTDVNDK